MNNALIHKAVRKIAVDYCRLSIVRNPDGFLSIDDVRRALFQQAGLTVVSGSNLALRILFETVYKKDGGNGRYVYLCSSIETLVPDMTQDAFITDFSIGDLFPLFADKSLLNGLSFEALSLLHSQCGIRRIPMGECRRMVEGVNREIEAHRRTSAEHFSNAINEIAVDWSQQSLSMENISSVMVDAVRNGVYEAIAPKINCFNQDFQIWIDSHYFATINSSHLLAPKMVHKILPHISEKHGSDDKVALVVVDGMAFWQYYVLKEHLLQRNIELTDSTTLAWIPTITMLSRQAIFRGDIPHQDYKQSPQNEQKLWREFWGNKGIPSYAVQYLSDNDEFAVNESVRRLAYVTVEMDEKMHSSSDYKDLLSLTENWCPRITEKILALKRMGFTVYLTTDHGSVLSQGWQPISQVEKVFLYKDGSRGKRHLIYNNKTQKDDFCKSHADEISLLNRDNWLAVRTDACFERKGQQLITHGGSHFWEVVVPFAII